MGRVGCLLNMVALLVGCLQGSVLKADLSRAVKKKRATSAFLFQVMLRGFLYVSGTCKLQLSCVNISKIA